MIISVMGFGKGKTESAIGCTVRALQNHEKVLFVQFLKDGKSLEIDFLNKYGNITMWNTGTKKITLPKNTTDEDREIHKSMISDIFEYITNYEVNLLVLDEILPALDLGLVTMGELEVIVTACEGLSIDVYMTGRVRSHYYREKIRNISDICSDVYCKKHCFDTYCEDCDNTYPYHFVYCPQCGKQLKPSVPSKKGRDY